MTIWAVYDWTVRCSRVKDVEAGTFEEAEKEAAEVNNGRAVKVYPLCQCGENVTDTSATCRICSRRNPRYRHPETYSDFARKWDKENGNDT